MHTEHRTAFNGSLVTIVRPPRTDRKALRRVDFGKPQHSMDFVALRHPYSVLRPSDVQDTERRP